MDPVAAWLLKTEPVSYSFSDLQREGATVWDGVTNPLARKHLAAMLPGDPVVVYHTGTERAVVGTAMVGSLPETATSPAGKSTAAVTILAGAALPAAVPLAAIKADPLLTGSDLVRLPRLSVVPLDEGQWRRILELGERPTP